MIVDITNEILTKLKTDLTGVKVVTSFQSGGEVYPKVVFTETDNSTDSTTVDSSGENHNIIAFDVNIFTNGSRQMSDAKKIRNDIDAIMADFYGMERTVSQGIPNYLNKDLYRYTLRYNCIVDENETIYRG